jgi:hypothetical protein
VYHSDLLPAAQQSQVVMTLPAGTRAFSFYVEPEDVFNTVNFTATSGGTSSGTVGVMGDQGARCFGFFCSSGNDFITTVTVAAASGSFAVGELGAAGEQIVGTAACSIPVDLPPPSMPGPPTGPSGSREGSNTRGAPRGLPVAQPVTAVPTFTG